MEIKRRYCMYQVIFPPITIPSLFKTSYTIIAFVTNIVCDPSIFHRIVAVTATIAELNEMSPDVPEK